MTTWRRKLGRWFKDDPEPVTKPEPKKADPPPYILIRTPGGAIARQYPDGRIVVPRSPEEIAQIRADEAFLRAFNASRKPGEKLYGNIDELRRDLGKHGLDCGGFYIRDA